MTAMEKYTSSPDLLAKAVPYVMAAFAAVMVCCAATTGISMAHSIPAARVSVTISMVFGPLVLVAVLMFSWLLKPLYVTMNNETIVINRHIKPVTIRLRDIRSVKMIPRPEMMYAIRVFGIGGVWCYTGKYYTRAHGAITLYGTQRQNYILIEKTNKKKIVITPDHPDAFLQQLMQTAPAVVMA